MATAIIGTGISGLGCAYRLAQAGEPVVVFEAADKVGGHTATKKCRFPAVITRLIPDLLCTTTGHTRVHFTHGRVGVTNQPTSMGFSVSDDITGLEYAGNNLNTLFAQRRNLLSA